MTDPEKPSFTGSPLAEFISSTKDQTIAALGDWELKAPIELELNAVVEGKVGGGVNIKIIEFGSNVAAEQQQKVKIAIGPKDPAKDAQDAANIAAAEVKLAASKKQIAMLRH